MAAGGAVAGEDACWLPQADSNPASTGTSPAAATVTRYGSAAHPAVAASSLRMFIDCYGGMPGGSAKDLWRERTLLAALIRLYA
jgi:hypothetical protein